MTSLHAKPTDRSTEEEDRFWATEANYFAYKEANPRAPQDSTEYMGWGIPPTKMPPADAVAYVIAHFRQDNLGWRIHDKSHPDFQPLHPMFRWSFFCVCMAHFLWFRTNAGAKWINGLFGVQEVQPFQEGYAYFWVDPTSGNAAPLLKPVYKPDPYNPDRKVLVEGVELRIFREWEKNLEPPCSAQNRAPIAEMKKLLARYRNPYAPSEPYIPSDEVFFWVSEILRDWFLETEPDRNWPTRKGDRIVGWQWVKSLERAPNERFYQALEKVGAFRTRAYRLQDNRGGVYWCSGKEIRIVPLKDLYLEQKQMSDEQVTEVFQCRNCRKRKPCVPATGENHRCCHCYAVEVERNDRPTLARCTMDRECKACPDVITSNSDLVELKNRLNRPARTGPVPR